MSSAAVPALKPGWWREARQPVEKRAAPRPRPTVKIEKYYTVKEVQEILRRSHTDGIYDLIKTKKLRAVKDGKGYLIGETALLEYLDANVA